MAEIGQAAGGVTAASGFGEEGYALVLREVSGEGLEGVGDVVADAGGVGARVVVVEVFVDIKD